MKLLFEKAKLDADRNTLQITLSFFFLARGTVEEKSATGLYRSLLHQLFEKAMELKDSLEWMTSDGARAVQRSGWYEEALKQTLTHAIKKLNSRSLTIFIDALDECDDSQATGMVGFFEELCDVAREAKVQLKICFSSRHYPTVVIQKGIEVTLEDEIGHTEDIEQYIRSKLRLGKSKQAELLRSEILEKSSGIFLWVVLVLDILNSEYPNSSISIKKIRDRLKEIPPKLTDLFEMMLTRDGQNLVRLQVCLKWILFATRPLKPQELYFAIQISLDNECLSWDQEDVELDQMKTFVRSSSKGLAEVTRNKASEVQFIHESVRDFLLGKYKGQWTGVSGNFVGNSHEDLKKCCLAQLNAAISEDIDIPDPLPQASKAAQLRETINLKFPFLEYSVLNVLCHANNAQQNAMDQGDFLADFPLQRWRFFNNTLERYDVRRYTKSVSLLYILAEKNLGSLIRIHPQREFCFDVENERYGLPIFAALATGSREAALTFLEIQAEIQPQEFPLHHLHRQFSKNRNKLTKLDRSFVFSQRRSVFSYVVDLDDEVILTFLCASGKLDINSKDRYNRTPLLWAAKKGYEVAVKLLLEKGDVELDTKDEGGRTPLLWAMANGHKVVVKLLLEKGADLKIPLLRAAASGQEAVVTLLLEEGVSLEIKDENSKGPLLLAAANGHEAVVKLLLEKCADLETKDKDGRTPLSWATENNHGAVVKLLIEKGAELETKDKDGRTPLSYAASSSLNLALLNYQMQLMLLEQVHKKRLMMSRQGQDNIMPCLAGQKDTNTVKPTEQQFLPGGPQNSLSPSNHMKPQSSKYNAVVDLLLENGAKLETKDKNGRTPLLWAVVDQHEAEVKLLLEKGADLETKDKDGRTPLLWAAEKKYEKVMKLLLEKGAKNLQ